MGPHPIQRRYLAEELMRARRADDQARFAASQRQGRIDPNPHQIDAVIFALKRIPEGGCILAAEVGLGKTIEAGLGIPPLPAEGRPPPLRPRRPQPPGGPFSVTLAPPLPLPAPPLTPPPPR